MAAPARKKLLLVITKSNWGGAQRYVYDLATGVPKDQFEIAVALGGAGELKERLLAAEITILPLTRMQRDLSLSADVSSFTALRETIRSYKPDIIHLNSSKAAGLGALAARLEGVPRIIFTAHGWPFEEKRNIFWRLFAYIGSWLTAFLSNQVIVVSQNDLRIGKRMLFGSHKIVLIHNGISLSMPFGPGEIIRNAFPAGAKITGTVGELTKNKNHISLIEEARSNPDRYVAIVGEGEDRAYLEAKIKEYGLEGRVKLFGFIPQSQALKGFDRFALPSIKEGLPYVLIEARAAGLPIEASRVGGVGDILDAKDMSEFSLERMLEKTIGVYR